MRGLSVGLCHDDEVDDDMAKSFGKGAMFPSRELLFKFAEEVIPDGAFTLSQTPTPGLKKRSCPSHIVGGRLVYRKLEDYQSQAPAPKSSSSIAAFQPSASTSRLKASALKSVEKMEEKRAKGVCR